MASSGTSTRARRISGEPAWLRPYTLWVFGLVVALLIGRWFIDKLFGFLVTLLLSLFVGFAIEPIVDRLARRGWRRGFATLAVYVVGGVAAAAFIALVGSLVVSQITGLVNSAPDGLAQISQWLKDNYNVNLPTSSTEITKNLSNVGPLLAGGALGFASSVLGLLFQTFTVALLGFYFATDGPRFRRAVCSVLPPARQLEVLRIWDLAVQKTAGFLYSRILLALLSGIAHGIFLAIIHVPYALTLGLFVGLISQFIPTVGTYIAGALPILVALTIDPQKALLVLAFVIIYQQIENYVISPPLSARTMSLHPGIAFGGVIVGASLLGPAGAFLALPLIATLQAFLSSTMTKHDLVDSQLFEDIPSVTEEALDEEPEDERTADEEAVDDEVASEMHGDAPSEAKVADAQERAGDA
jgi:predicted PurR-regulated permease PerM